MSGKMRAVTSCPDGNRSTPEWVDRIEWPLATVTLIDWAGGHSCTFDKHEISLIAKHSPVDSESAFAL